MSTFDAMQTTLYCCIRQATVSWLRKLTAFSPYLHCCLSCHWIELRWMVPVGRPALLARGSVTDYLLPGIRQLNAYLFGVVWGCSTSWLIVFSSLLVNVCAHSLIHCLIVFFSTVITLIVIFPVHMFMVCFVLLAFSGLCLVCVLSVCLICLPFCIFQREPTWMALYSLIVLMCHQ